MMDEVCMYNKFRYCKFQDHCKRVHFGEICQKFKTCQATKTCHKRHPKNVRKMKPKTDADLEMNVPTSTKHNKVNVKLMQQRLNMTFLKK